jgi:hypothetical protein
MKRLHKMVQTENTGKIFEMAICKTYNIPYVGKYKYGMEEPEILKNKLISLKNHFPQCIHTAGKHNRYDFTSIDGINHLSAKTSKLRNGKVAPQCIGQATPINFCNIIGITFISILALKEYIQKNITIILPFLINYTFDCPNLYYNKEKNTIQYIQLIQEIDWLLYEYKWSKTYNEWNNSSILKIKINENYISLVEIQFHSTRPNMAIRWYYDNFLTIFNNHLNIKHIL